MTPPSLPKLLAALLLPGTRLLAQATNTVEEVTAELGRRAAAVPSPEELASRLDLRQIIDQGGFLIYVLAAMSVIGLALVFYCLVVLGGRRIAPASFVRDLEVLLRHGRFKEIRAACSKNRSPVAAITLAAVDYLERSQDHDARMIAQVVEGEGVRQVGRLQSQITYLMDIGVIAPMVGLLGTVMGMLRSFSVVALDIAKARPVELANGVSQALITTAAGLIVAIPAMIAYSIFRGRLAKLTANLELVAADIVSSLTHRREAP